MSKLSEFVKNFAELGHRRVRKNPRIYPKAKSKLFKVKQPIAQDPVEAELLTQWWTDYRLQYHAVRSLFKYELAQHEAQTLASARTDDASDRVRRFQLAQSWNADTRAKAMDKLTGLLDQMRLERSKRLEQFQTDELALDQKLDGQIASVAAHMGQFITRENMDEKIDAIMNAPIVDYNFLVDQSGGIISGTTSAPQSTIILEASQTTDSVDRANVTSVKV